MKRWIHDNLAEAAAAVAFAALALGTVLFWMLV